MTTVSVKKLLNYKKMKNYFLDEKFDPFNLRKMPKILGIPFLHNVGNELVEVVMENDKVRNFIKTREKFDVCFLEVFHFHALSVSCI